MENVPLKELLQNTIQSIPDGSPLPSDEIKVLDFAAYFSPSAKGARVEWQAKMNSPIEEIPPTICGLLHVVSVLKDRLNEDPSFLGENSDLEKDDAEETQLQ